MHSKSTIIFRYKATKVGKSFTSEKSTSYSGLIVINDYVNQLGLFGDLYRMFSIVKNNATKILHAQLFSMIIFVCLCGINRLSRIAKFTQDPLVCKLLGLTN